MVTLIAHFLCVWVEGVLESEPRASQTLGKHFAAEFHSHPNLEIPIIQPLELHLKI